MPMNTAKKQQSDILRPKKNPEFAQTKLKHLFCDILSLYNSCITEILVLTFLSLRMIPLCQSRKTGTHP